MDDSVEKSKDTNSELYIEDLPDIQFNRLMFGNQQADARVMKAN